MMKHACARLAIVGACAAALILFSTFAVEAADVTGVVVDAAGGKPIAGAMVTSGTTVVRSNQQGEFRIAASAGAVGARAYGYRRAEANLDLKNARPLRIPLAAITPHALYLSYWGVSSRSIRKDVLALAGSTPVNAVVIDVKGDLGFVSYRTAVPLASQIGAQKIATIPDIHALLLQLHSQGFYVIARIVAFKDNKLGPAHQELALKQNGKLWRDREGLTWCDPFLAKVREYNIDLAVDAAKNGFDEIQFDYVRFPDAKGLQFSQESTEASRTKTIAGFLKEARARLVPYNVFLAADVFGYICWNTTDTGIGQHIEDLGAELDYISPMLYPSGFQYGIPGLRNPLQNPSQIVKQSLERALQRTGLPAIRFRPWLQGFSDYAFDKRKFGRQEIQDQIQAANGVGTNGWMLWNPRNVYSAATLQTAAEVKLAASRERK